MRLRFPALPVLVAAALACALVWPVAAALAQTVTPPGVPHGGAIEPMRPPKDLPHAQRGDHAHNLDFLFGALKVAPDDESAKLVENRIWALWLTSGGDTANLLMTRASQAIEAKNLDLGLKLLDAIIAIKPDYVEAWNRRATLHYLRKEYGQAMRDIQEVLVLEPRHFGAMSGLGMILNEFGDEKQALVVFRRVQAINPHMPKINDMVKSLTEKVEGRDI